MQNHSRALCDIASAQKLEGERMTRLTRQTAQDSKMLKALTIMATLYLPASLLAVGTYLFSLGYEEDVRADSLDNLQF